MNQQKKDSTFLGGWISYRQAVPCVMARTASLVPHFRKQNLLSHCLTAMILMALTMAAAQSALAITEIPIPTASSDPEAIAAGPGGTIWFAEFGADKIGRVTTSTGLIIEYPLPLGSAPLGIVAGPDGNIWFTMAGRDLIGRLNLATNVITEFTVPGAGSQPARITAGPDGRLWFTEAGSDQIGVITVDGVVVEFTVPGAGSSPFGITTGPDGALWFTEAGSGQIGRITTAGVVTSEVSIVARPQGITTGPDGNLWFALALNPNVGRLTTGNVPTFFGGFGTANTTTRDITTGPDGFLWFTDFAESRIDRISTSGVVTEFPTPTAGSLPVSIVTGPDGRLWFTEALSNKIGALNPNNPAEVISFAPISASGTTVNAVEGAPFANAVVATFTPSSSSLLASNFSATINWGDGTAFSSGTVTSNGIGSFIVRGDHTYAEEGSYNIAVTIHDIANNFDATANTAATVADAPLTITPISAGARTEFSGVGGNNTSITAGTANAAMLAFQAAIGGANNGGNPPPQANGFRTINWDGVGLTATDGAFTNQVIVPNHVVGIPINRFQARGVQFEEIYAVADDGFTSVNPGVAGQFPAFSPTKTFAMFNDNTIDFSFVLPSSPTSTPVQAVTRGFGAIFLDVETPNTTSIEYFSNGTSLGKFFVPVGGSGQPEFLGELFLNTAITNVHIELGTATLFSFDGTTVAPGPADNPGAGTDLAVTDDFVYAEPTVLPTGITINAISGAPFTARVASFTDADPAGQLSDYSSLINWGDGSFSAGTITPNGFGGFDVTGTHTYNSVPHTFTVFASVSDTGGSRTSGQSTVIVSAQPSLSIGNATVTEGNSGTTNAAFTITLSSASSQTVTVDYVTGDGTATSPSDYDAQAGTLTFAPGVTSRTINVAVKGDTVPEPNETFLVTLLNPVNATIATAQGTGTINDDDESGFVQFDAATATVAENAGSVSLTVTRTGDTSGVTTVNFETSDGTATQKNDYTFGFGTIQFGPGETSKTIKVLLVDDVFVEGPENFKVTLSNTSGNFVVGSQNQITVTITDNDSMAPTTNPIDDTTFFVRQHYLDFLGREADAPGLAFWTGQINSCGANLSCIAAKRVDVSASFFLSIEFQETGGYALRVQRAAFGRQSNDPVTRYPYLQFMRDTRTIGQGVIVGQAGFDTLLEQNKQAYAQQIVLTNEFTIRFPPAPAAVYVDALFASAGVTPTPAERTAAINAFGAGGTIGRVAALRSVTDSTSVRTAESRISFVLAEYYGYLRRNPTDAPDFSDAGYQFWLNKLNLFNGNYLDAEMVKAFITSIEYRQRFGP